MGQKTSSLSCLSVDKEATVAPLPSGTYSDHVVLKNTTRNPLLNCEHLDWINQLGIWLRMDNKTFETANLLKSYEQYITKYSQKEILNESFILQHHTRSELPEECTFKLLLVDQYYHSNQSITKFLNSIKFNGSYKTCLVINDDEPLSRKIEFNLFDHIIYLNKDIDQLYFQLHQFFVACQKESFSRYKLFLTSDVFLQFHAERRTLVDTNSSQYSAFIGTDELVSFNQEIDLKLSACHYVHTAEISFNNCKINCHLYKIDEVILAVICEREKHRSVKASASCHNGNKSNINSLEASDTIKPLASESQTCYTSKSERPSHHERRRSSLAKLQLKMVQKSPVVDLLQRIKDQQITLNDCLQDGETKDNLFSLFEDISDVLGKLVQLPPLAKHHISDKTIGDPQSTDLAYGLLNKPSQRGKNPLKSSTRASTIHSKRTSQPIQPAAPVNPEIVSASLNENYVLPSNDSVALPPEGIEEIEDHSLAWEFDVFKIENLSNFTPLEHVGMDLFRKFNAFKLLKIDETTCLNWLKIIQSNYRSSNTYHNSTHAADVMQASAHFLTSTRCQNLLAPLDMVACLVAAAVHDVDHRGKTNQFLCNSMDPLAIFYNDKAVLENHHVAMGFQLTLAVDEKFNILKNLDDSEFKSFRNIVIEMVLATEMSVHFDIVNKFINLASQDQANNDSSASENGQEKSASRLSRRGTIRTSELEEDRKLLSSLTRRMIIKVADISNPVRPINQCFRWTTRICEEYFRQTDEEKRRDLPVVMPSFDRETCSVPKSQIFFIDYFVRDMVDAWTDFIDDDKLMQYLDDNQNFWRRIESRNIKSLQDTIDVKDEESRQCKFIDKKPV